MTHAIEPRAWWELHLRQARGEALSEEEQRLYDAEIARQDREAEPLKCDLDSLKKMRQQVRALAQTSSALRDRLAELDREIQSAEQSLSPETRGPWRRGVTAMAHPQQEEIRRALSVLPRSERESTTDYTDNTDTN